MPTCMESSSIHIVSQTMQSKLARAIDRVFTKSIEKCSERTRSRPEGWVQGWVNVVENERCIVVEYRACFVANLLVHLQETRDESSALGVPFIDVDLVRLFIGQGVAVDFVPKLSWKFKERVGWDSRPKSQR